MRFNGSAAWGEAMRLVSANKEVLAVIAGVFIFLPAVGLAFAMGGIQQTMMTQMMQAGLAGPGAGAANSAAQMQMLGTMWSTLGPLLPWFFVISLVQAIGHMAMLALLADRARPTVGEALTMAIKALPSMIGVMLLLIVGYLVVGLAIGLVIGLVVGVLGFAHLQALGFVLAVVAILVVIAFFATRLSMILPVLVMEGVRGPVAVITGSWKLVQGNTRRLFLFYLLLFIAYIVIAMVIGMVVGAILGIVFLRGGGMPLQASSSFLLANGIVSGLIGAVAATMMIGVLAAVHRQLSGSTAAVAETFA